jgi:rhamnogalacturonyl hydrolase YesR
VNLRPRLRFLVLAAIFLSAMFAAAQTSTPGPSGRFPYARAVADTQLARFPDPDAIHWRGSDNHFSWQAGYMMFTMEKLWRLSGDRRYLDYIRRYVDQNVDVEGRIPNFKPDALDNFIPGYAILLLWEETHLERYRKAATTIHKAFAAYPRNSDGSFWHAQWASHQMWVDGVFMGQIFEARYGRDFHDAAALSQAAAQMKIILAHCRKPNGLLLHGWDESRKASWADKKTGLAREVWSEGLGWFAVLIADVFDYLPAGHPDRPALMQALQDLCAGLKQVQDPKTGMWNQVVDKPGAPGNWNETSGTGMFTYLIKTASDKGYVPRAEYLPIAQRAYAGMVAKALPAADGRWDVIDLSSIGIQDTYDAYIHSPHETNTFAGISSFILGASAVEKDL